MKNQKGITIITLVVTIIVLIILAGVSINMLLGENGIITKAKEAAKMHEIASIKEEIRIKILEQEIETEGQVTQENIETILSNYGTINKNEDGTIKSLTPTGKYYEIAYEEIYTGTTVQEGNNSENASDGTDTDSSSDTVTLTKEEYNSIIERLDALDGGSKSSVSIAAVEANISTIQDNANLSISDINSNLNNNIVHFPDTSNVIDSMNLTNTSSNCAYTATQNCWAFYLAYKHGTNDANDCYVYLNNVSIAGDYLSNNYNKVSVFVPLQKGDTIRFNGSTFYKQYTIYGVVQM